MKRIFALVIACIFMYACTCSVAEESNTHDVSELFSIDLASMTDDDLVKAAEAIKAEQKARLKVKIQLEAENVNVRMGASIRINATIVDIEDGVREGKYTWETSSGDIATVSNGTVRGVNAGKAVITCKNVLSDGTELEQSIEIEVIVPVSNIISTEKTIIMAPGTTWKVGYRIEPSNAALQELDWASSNEAIATVDTTGKVKAQAVGRCNISGTSKDGTNRRITIPVQVEEHDLIILEPMEVDVDFATSSYSGDMNIMDAYVTDEAGNKIIITEEDFKEGGRGHHIDSNDGRILISVPDRDNGYKYFELDPDTGRVFETSVRKLKITGTGVGKQSSSSTTVTYLNGLACEGTKQFKLRPLKAGSETVEITTKKDNRVTSKIQYRIFISQEAAPFEGDKEIKRLSAISENGHTYQLFFSNRTWDQAMDFCKEHGGHLVTITTEEEQSLIAKYVSDIPDKQFFWIGIEGGKDNSFSSWITREGISFTNWANGSPHKNEPGAVALFVSKDVEIDGRTFDAGNWNDEKKTFYYIDGFICEWDEEDSAKALNVE